MRGRRIRCEGSVTWTRPGVHLLRKGCFIGTQHLTADLVALAQQFNARHRATCPASDATSAKAATAESSSSSLQCKSLEASCQKPGCHANGNDGDQGKESLEQPSNRRKELLANDAPGDQHQNRQGKVDRQIDSECAAVGEASSGCDETQ